MDINIFSRINEIFIDALDMDLNNYNKRDYEDPLLGNKFRLEPRDLLYLFFEIEKKFGITIPEQAVMEGKFDSIKNIYDIVYNQLHART